MIPDSAAHKRWRAAGIIIGLYATASVMENPAPGTIRTVKAACPHDCPDTCALEISVADGRAVAVRGGNMPFTEGFASDKLLLLGVASKARDQKSLTTLSDELSFEPYSIALPRGDADFRLAVNNALSQLYGSGEITGIFNRWFGMFGDPGAVTRIMFLLGRIPE